jgi:hypothetical protein
VRDLPPGRRNDGNHRHRPPRVRALLPVHAPPSRQRRLSRPQPHRGATAGPAIGHERRAHRHLGQPGRTVRPPRHHRVHSRRTALTRLQRPRTPHPGCVGHLSAEPAVQISVTGDWLTSWPDPSAYLPAFFSCGGSNGNGYYCSRGLDRQMQRAQRLELTNPVPHKAIWESVDRRLTDAAVRGANRHNPRRRTHIEPPTQLRIQPVWGFLADHSWLN